MNSAQNFSYAQLALAAYAQPLVAGRPPSVNALRIGGKGMSEKQALEFASLWTVVDQFTESESGVSATIFHKEGEFVLAIRGTEFQAGDLLADGLLALGVSASLNPQFTALNAKLAEWMGESGRAAQRIVCCHRT